MAFLSAHLLVGVLVLLVTGVHADELFYEWHVKLETTIKPVNTDQPVMTINGMFPGPLINATTNDNIHVNVFNEMDEPILFTWNGIQLRLNSFQDGVSGTNCPILPGKNWTYEFQVKDQIGTFFYFPSLHFQKAAGGFGPIRVNNRIVIQVPFAKPEDEYELLIGDWYSKCYKDIRSQLNNTTMAYNVTPDRMLMNGRGSYLDNSTLQHAEFRVIQGKTYRFRISNVGTSWSFNFRIQNHKMLLVETEGSYTSQIVLDSLDVHVGQSYSVLVTANQNLSDYLIVATPKNATGSKLDSLVASGVLHYVNSTTNATLSIPDGPDPFDLEFSMNQARSIRWNLTTGAARPNPQGAFSVWNETLLQSFFLRAGKAEINGAPCYTVNNVSYVTTDTPLKLIDYLGTWSGAYILDQFSTVTSNVVPIRGVFVSNGLHRGYIEIVFQNDMDIIDSWHLDGFSLFVVGYGVGVWNAEARNVYNLKDPVDRSTVQVYPKGWTAVYGYLDNPGMWNLRSQILKNWYLGEELYLRVYDPDDNPAKERPPPANILLCGQFRNFVIPRPPPALPTQSPPAPAPAPARASSWQTSWFNVTMFLVVASLPGLLIVAMIFKEKFIAID